MLTKGQFEMNGTIRIVFDTSAVIKLLNNQYNLPSLGIHVDEAQLFTSVMTRMELLSKPQISDAEKQDLQKFLDKVSVMPIAEEIEQKAIELRRSTKLKLPDCIIAATSIVLDAVLLTNDHHLLNLSWQNYKPQNIY